MEQTGYDSLWRQFKRVNFKGEAPWLDWNAGDLQAIERLFPYGDNNAQDAPDVHDGYEVRNRQANPEAGRLLFVLSQQEGARFRGWRLRAFNGSYVPVVSAELIEDRFCSNFITFVGLISTNQYHLILDPHKRPTPHHNWSGDLPERKPTAGEVQFEKNQGGGTFPGNFPAFGMKEWSILKWDTQQNPYNFETKVTKDLGAIRIVSVHFRSQRLPGGGPPAYWDTGATHQDRKYRLERDSPTGYSPVYKADPPVYDRDNRPAYTGPTVTDKQTHKMHGFIDEEKYKGPTERLWKRRSVRVYFTFNHYRPVEFNVKSHKVQLSPWFAVEC